MAEVMEHVTWTDWREYDAGGTWDAALAYSGQAQYAPGTRTVDIRLTTAPPPAGGTFYGSGAGQQVAIELTSLGGSVWQTIDGTDVSGSVVATLSLTRILVVGPSGGGVTYGPLQLQITNPLTVPVVFVSATGQLHYITRDAIYPAVTPPGGATGTTSPTSSVPTDLPTDVVQRKSLEAANPGLNMDLTFYERYDLLGVQLGQRVNLTITELGIIGRGYVVTKIKHHFQGQLSGTNAPGLTLTSTFHVEKIPGTLLPGGGTSTPAQDAAGTGAEISAYLTFDDASSGFDLGNFGP